jgi:hypothetical protein
MRHALPLRFAADAPLPACGTVVHPILIGANWRRRSPQIFPVRVRHAWPWFALGSVGRAGIDPVLSKQ